MKKLLWAIPAVGLAGLLASGYVLAPGDQAMIDRALKESTDAAAKGEPSDVLKYLSRSFTYDGESANTFDISKVINQAKPKIAILQTRAQISGEEAEVVTPVDVQLDYMGFALNQTIPNVSIKLKKESAFKWGIVPEPRWRIVSVTAEQLPDY